MQGFMTSLLTCSIAMSVIAVLLMALSPLMARHFSAKGRYYAWLFVIIGLIIPYRPETDAVVKIDLTYESLEIGPTEIILSAIGPDTEETAPAPAPIKKSIPLASIAFAIWAAGALCFIIRKAVQHYRFLNTTRRWSEHISSGPTFLILRELKASMGIRRPVELYLCPCVNSPMLSGVLKPQILLPNTDFSVGDLRHILKHELVHLKRNDIWYKLLTLLATAIHWFNPVAYLSCRAIDLLCEISCDDEVVRGADSDVRFRYTKTIIGVLRYQSGMKTALSTSFWGGKSGMKKRISSIMDTTTKWTGVIIICAALILSAGSGFAFAATASIDSIVSTQDFLDILLNLESTGAWINHDPQEGQISREQAIHVAEEAALRLAQQLHAQDIGTAKEMTATQAYLRKTTSYNGPNIDLTSYDPKYSFWFITLSTPDGLTSAQFLIHAATGSIWRASINDYPANSGADINEDSALSWFIDGLGLEGFDFDKSNIAVAQVLKEENSLITYQVYLTAKGK